jgi:hypothetical protein
MDQIRDALASLGVFAVAVVKGHGWGVYLSTIPALHFWFSGAAPFLAGSFAFTVAVGLIGIRQVISHRTFAFLLVVAIALSGLAWHTAAKQEEDSATEAKHSLDLEGNIGDLKGQLSTITQSNKTQEEQLAKLASQNTELQNNLAKIANAANLNPNQSADKIAAAVIAKIEPLQKQVDILSQRPKDTLYQDNLPIGRAARWAINDDHTLVTLQGLATTQELDFSKDMEMQGLRLSCNSPTGVEGILGIGTVHQFQYGDTFCKVLGPR